MRVSFFPFGSFSRPLKNQKMFCFAPRAAYHCSHFDLKRTFLFSSLTTQLRDGGSHSSYFSNPALSISFDFLPSRAPPSFFPPNYPQPSLWFFLDRPLAQNTIFDTSCLEKLLPPFSLNYEPLPPFYPPVFGISQRRIGLCQMVDSPRFSLFFC